MPSIKLMYWRNTYIPFFFKHKDVEIAMITAIAPNVNTPSTLLRIAPVLAADLFLESVATDTVIE